MSADQRFFMRKVQPVKALLSHKAPQLVIVGWLVYHILTTEPIKTAVPMIVGVVFVYIALFWAPIPPLRNQPVAATVYRILRHRIVGGGLERNKQNLHATKRGISIRGRPVPRMVNHLKWLGRFWPEPFDYNGNTYGIANDRKEKTLSASMYVMGQSQQLKDPNGQWPVFQHGWSDMIDELSTLSRAFHRFSTTTYTSIGDTGAFATLLKSIEEGQHTDEIPDFMLKNIWDGFRNTASHDTYFNLTIQPRLLPRKTRKQYGGRDILVDMTRALYRVVLPNGPSPIDLDAAVILDVNALTKVMRQALDPFESWINTGVPPARAGIPESVIHPDHALPDWADFSNPKYSVIGDGTLACSWYIDEYGPEGMSFTQLAEFYSLAIPKALTVVIGILPDEMAGRWADFHKDQAEQDIRKKERRSQARGVSGPRTKDLVELEAIQEHAEEVARGQGVSVTEACYLTVYAKSEAEMALYKKAVEMARRNAKVVLRPLNDEQWKGLGAALPMGRGLDTLTSRSLIRMLHP